MQGRQVPLIQSFISRTFPLLFGTDKFNDDVIPYSASYRICVNMIRSIFGSTCSACAIAKHDLTSCPALKHSPRNFKGIYAHPKQLVWVRRR